VPQNVLIVAWLIGGSIGAFFLLRGIIALNTRLQTRLGSAAHAPEGDDRANGFVQVVGFCVAVLGGAFVAFGRNWAVAFIPLPFFGAGVVLLGAWMMTFPEKYRAAWRRYRR